MSAAAHSPPVSQEASRRALFKLLAFTVSLAFVPILSFFASKTYVWDGDSTWAALTAVFAANFVLILFIVQSIRDDTPPSTISTETKPASSIQAEPERVSEIKKSQ